MFMVISKDKIVSYLISLGTVMGLFVFSFFISEQNDKIIQSSANIINTKSNGISNNLVINEAVNERLNEENLLKNVENDGNVTKILQK